MKKLFLTAATAMVCLFISCNDTGTTTTTNDNDAQAENKAKLQTIHNALETGDVSKLDSLIDKDVVDHGNPMGDVKGIDSVKKWFVDFHNNTKDVKVESIAAAVNGNYSFDLNRMTGTFTNPFMGMPAGPFDMTAVDVVKLKDGKATEHWGFMDPKEMMKMMGGDHTMDKMDSKMAPKDSAKK
ncbi:MAG TPA: nuclear transport factor 2 family protein [Chitinophagaceae bacterium]|nr:nuclear transport factor 2 family protein [Chitinophagaceae bacterium]